VCVLGDMPRNRKKRTKDSGPVQEPVTAAEFAALGNKAYVGNDHHRAAKMWTSALELEAGMEVYECVCV
jgi:hypothetical protein